MAIISVSMTLTALAKRFDQIADVSQGKGRTRALRYARQMRTAAEETVCGRMTVDTGWILADAAAGQITKDGGQIEKKMR